MNHFQLKDKATNNGTISFVLMSTFLRTFLLLLSRDEDIISPFFFFWLFAVDELFRGQKLFFSYRPNEALKEKKKKFFQVQASLTHSSGKTPPLKFGKEVL